MITNCQPIDSAGVQEMIYALRGHYRFLNTVPIGHSVLGKPIWALMLGDHHDRILYTAAFHAQEWITALILLRLCENICRAMATDTCLSGIDLRRALAGRGLVFVPLVNPDGVDIARHGSGIARFYEDSVRALGGDTAGLWQANARGVDLNHNFCAGWHVLHEQEIQAGISGPSPRRWGGPTPESEPETAALTGLCRYTSFRHAIALHTQGEEIYWRYGDRTPDRSRLMAEIMAASSGYTVSDPTGLAAHGGFKDWFIWECGRPAFTIEMGKGQNPLPIGDFETIYNQTEEMLLLAALM